MLYADGDYNKRKNTAVAKRHKVIEEKKVDAEGPQDVLQIGGASWSDLTRLSESELRDLDADLEEYQEWFLVKLPADSIKRATEIGEIERISGIVDRRMRALLAKHDFRYEELSHLHTAMRFWEEPWSRLDDGSPLANIVISLTKECLLGDKAVSFVIAARTLKGLMIWRKIWKMEPRK